jgi:hypothetical protein
LGRVLEAAAKQFRLLTELGAERDYKSELDAGSCTGHNHYLGFIA